MITINLDKAKVVAHKIRRARREEEFAPFDALIAKQIPTFPVPDLEAKRWKIRQKYHEMQAAIDAAEDVEEVKSCLEKEGT